MPAGSLRLVAATTRRYNDGATLEPIVADIPLLRDPPTSATSYNLYPFDMHQCRVESRCTLQDPSTAVVQTSRHWRPGHTQCFALSQLPLPCALLRSCRYSVSSNRISSSQRKWILPCPRCCSHSLPDVHECVARCHTGPVTRTGHGHGPLWVMQTLSNHTLLVPTLPTFFYCSIPSVRLAPRRKYEAGCSSHGW